MGVHIEKNQGCNHMTCRKHAGGCGHEFCWLCKGDWSKHGSATGGYYQCNIYEKNKTRASYPMRRPRSKMPKTSWNDTSSIIRAMTLTPNPRNTRSKSKR